MDYLSSEHIIALQNIANTINTPRCFDWWILSVVATSLIAFIVLTIWIGHIQKETQRDAIKIQMFDKRYNVFKSVA